MSKEREGHIQKVHEQIQKHLKEKRSKRANQPEHKWQQPRYDEVFEAGIARLEEVAQMDEDGSMQSKDVKVIEKFDLECLTVGIFATSDGSICTLRALTSFECGLPLPWYEINWDGERIYCVAVMRDIPWRCAVHTYSMLLNMIQDNLSIPDLVRYCYFDYKYYNEDK